MFPARLLTVCRLLHICVCGLGCFGDLSRDHAPLRICHLFKVIPTPHSQLIFCLLRVLVYGWSLMHGDLHEISAQYQNCWSYIRWLNWILNWRMRIHLSPTIVTGLKGEQIGLDLDRPDMPNFCFGHVSTKVEWLLSCSVCMHVLKKVWRYCLDFNPPLSSWENSNHFCPHGAFQLPTPNPAHLAGAIYSWASWLNSSSVNRDTFVWSTLGTYHQIKYIVTYRCFSSPRLGTGLLA